MSTPGAACRAGDEPPPVWSALILEARTQHGPDRQCRRERQREIGQRQAADREVTEGGCRDESGVAGRQLVVPAACDGRSQQAEGEATQRREGACGGLGDAQHGIRCRDEPVEQDRLLKSDIIVIVGGEPVAAREHLASSLGVERFIRVPNCRASEAGEIGHPAEKDEEQSRTAHCPEFYLRLCCTSEPLGRSIS